MEQKISAYTPGPWKAAEPGVVRGPRNEWIAEVGNALGTQPANVALIAAAPQLVEAVKECLTAEIERRKQLLPGAPATTYCEARIARIEAALRTAGLTP